MKFNKYKKGLAHGLGLNLLSVLFYYIKLQNSRFYSSFSIFSTVYYRRDSGDNSSQVNEITFSKWMNFCAKRISICLVHTLARRGGRCEVFRLFMKIWAKFWAAYIFFESLYAKKYARIGMSLTFMLWTLNF